MNNPYKNNIRKNTRRYRKNKSKQIKLLRALVILAIAGLGFKKFNPRTHFKSAQAEKSGQQVLENNIDSEAVEAQASEEEDLESLMEKDLLAETSQEAEVEPEPREEEAEKVPSRPLKASPTIVAESPAVDLSYFEDAVFIGNSRTEMFLFSTNLPIAKDLADTGLNVKSAFTKRFVPHDGGKLTAMEALAHTKFSKAYIMFGVNEACWPYPDAFIKEYSKIIHRVLELNPEATIYVQAIIPVTNNISKNYAHITNESIDKLNGLILEMAERENVHFLNLADHFKNEEGVLPDEAASDGLHMSKTYCLEWLEYLRTHTI